MKFELPEINIEIFEVENIVATSSISSAAQELAAQLSQISDGGVNVVDWDMYSK